MGITKTKILLILLTCTMMAICLVGGLSIYTANSILERASVDKLQLQCETAVQKIDISIRNVQRSVNILRRSIQEEQVDLNRFEHEQGFEARFTKQQEGNLKLIAENTAGCVAAYVRYNPALASPTSGLFYVLDQKTFKFRFLPPTDFSLYQSTDLEHVGWYYVPVQHRGPMWILPYQNENIDLFMISYVIPIFTNKISFGVVGMDVDFNYIQKVVEDLSVYETGYAFLTYDDKIIYHKDYKRYTQIDTVLDKRAQSLRDAILWSTVSDGQYIYKGQRKSFACKNLENGMKLIICAPSEEIYADSYRLTRKLIVISTFSLVLILLLASYLIGRAIKMANVDSLTGLPNRKAFIQGYARFGREEDGTYGLFLLDIDCFKSINDRYGHNRGDCALTDLAKAARRYLGEKALLGRWGGDEFIGVLPVKEIGTRLEELRHYQEMCENSGYGRLTVSIGITTIKKGKRLIEVTKAADEALYRSKTS